MDIVSTRKNDAELGVLNRQSWRVKKIEESYLLVESTEDQAHRVALPMEYVNQSVEMAYAITGHGSQGMTVGQSHVLVTEATDAAGLYVGLSRGRFSNQAHFVASDMEEAFSQFVSAARRDNADRGLAPAREALLKQLKDMGCAPKSAEAFTTPIRVGDVRAGQVLRTDKDSYTVLDAQRLASGEVKLHLANAQKTWWTKPLERQKMAGVYAGENTALKLPKSVAEKVGTLEADFRAMVLAKQYVGQVQDWAKAHAEDLSALGGSQESVRAVEEDLVRAEERLAQVQQDYERALAAREGFLVEPRQKLNQAQQAWDSAGGFARTFGRVFSRLEKAQQEWEGAQERAGVPSDEVVVRCGEQVEQLKVVRDERRGLVMQERAALVESMPELPRVALRFVLNRGVSVEGALDVRLVEGFEVQMKDNLVRRFELSGVSAGYRA